MTDGLLEDIIQWEKQIQQQLAAEEQRVAAWSEQETAALEERLSVARKHAEDDDREALEAAREDARREAEARLKEAEQWCERLQAIDDQTLGEILQRHIEMIMPEAADDHSHGKS